MIKNQKQLLNERRIIMCWKADVWLAWAMKPMGKDGLRHFLLAGSGKERGGEKGQSKEQEAKAAV